jgi:hypothetical protein
MQKTVLFFLLLFLSATSPAQEMFQLSAPLLKYQSGFFKNKMEVEIKFAQPGTSVYYTLNGKEPTEKDFLYTQPVIISDKEVTVKAKAIGENFYPSETVSATFIREGIKPGNIILTEPDNPYTANGSAALIDNAGGFTALDKNTWLGYKSDSVAINLFFKKRKRVNEMLINFLQNEGSWIFLPEQISIYYYDKKEKTFLPWGNELIFSIEPQSGAHCIHRSLFNNRNIKTNQLRIEIYPLKNIPGWHSAKGQHSWCFIDEIKVY